jgi:hypothetical protein
MHLQLGLRLPQGLVAAVDDMHKRARVGLLALHIVPLDVLDVFVTGNPRAGPGKCLRTIAIRYSSDIVRCKCRCYQVRCAKSSSAWPHPPLSSNLIG